MAGRNCTAKRRSVFRKRTPPYCLAGLLKSVDISSLTESRIDQTGTDHLGTEFSGFFAKKPLNSVPKWSVPVWSIRDSVKELISTDFNNPAKQYGGVLLRKTDRLFAVQFLPAIQRKDIDQILCIPPISSVVCIYKLPI